MRYTKTVYIKTSGDFAAQFARLKVGQWCTGMKWGNESRLWRGQYMGPDNAGHPIVNFRVDNTKKSLNWRNQFASNRPLRQFARVKSGGA